MQIISASIDLSKIDKAKIKTTDKDGKPYTKGQKFYDITIKVNDDFDKFNNNVAILNAQTKEEREAKATGVFIGNGRIVWSSAGKQQPAEKPSNEGDNSAPSSDDLPF